jgi:hypothetical protein
MLDLNHLRVSVANSSSETSASHNNHAMKRDTRFQPGVSGNQAAKWKPGQSGNPAGKSRLRLRFEETFNEALLTQGGPEEAARLLWEAARKREPWAIQELCRRFAPEAASLHLVHEVHDHEIDYHKLSDEQLQQLEAILGPVHSQPDGATGGEGPAQPL